MQQVEVFAEVTCPFAHVGLKRVAAKVAELDDAVLVVRAWPLEWVNGTPLDADGVSAKASALEDQLDVGDFHGFDPATWPTTTLPAHDLTAAAYERDPETGLAVALKLRSALFEQGLDIGDPTVLSGIAARFGLTAPVGEPSAAVHADYDEGSLRGVQGSPHYFVGEQDFFCPSLDLDHDDEGALTAEFDADGLDEFLASLDSDDDG